jgi:hypothetical protein
MNTARIQVEFSAITVLNVPPEVRLRCGMLYQEGHQHEAIHSPVTLSMP